MAALSVVIPAHNVAAYLPACLDSILAAAPDGVQVVGVDDASPDRCGEIFDDYARRDARMRVVHLDTNHGLGPARNAGLDASTGKYIWFVDADDVVATGAARAVLQRLREVRPDVLLLRHAWLVEGRTMADPHAPRVPRFPGVAAVTDRPALLRVRQAAWNRVVRRDLVEHPALRFPPGWYEDVAFSHLSLVAAEQVATLGSLGYVYRQREGAITATTSPRHFEVFAQYERLFAGLPRWPAGEALWPYLFELMIEHYLVIVGTDDRVPDTMKPDFFERIVEHYRRFLPAQGYQMPKGLNGVKQRFVRWDTYGLFRTMRNAYRTGRRAQHAISATLRRPH